MWIYGESYLPETVQSLALSLESVDNVEGSDSLSLGVFSVGDRVLDDTFKEDLEHTSGLFVNQTGDSPVRKEKVSKRYIGWL
jgi:hypothetical protein